MEPNNYMELQKRTEPTGLTKKELMINWALGICGESAELFKIVRWGDENGEVEVLNEAGDVMFYSSAMARVFGWDLQELVDAIKMENMVTRTTFSAYDIKDFSDDLVQAAGDLADLIKKIAFHGHPEDKKATANIFNRLAKVVFLVGRIAYDAGWTLEEVMTHNIEKLRKRYPEGFSAEASINREV